MDSVLFNNLISQIQEKTGMQFDENLKNDCKVLFEKISQPNKHILQEQKNKVITLNNFLNSCIEMNNEDICNIISYVAKLNKDYKDDLIELPNFEKNQKQLLFMFSSLSHLIKDKDEDKDKELESNKIEKDLDKILDNVLQEQEFVIDKVGKDKEDENKDLDDELADELEELNNEKENPKTLENSFGDLSKLIEMAKELTSKVNLDDKPIDFNKLTDKDYFNKVAKNIQENEDILQNSDEISKIVESNPLLKSIHDQLLNRIEKSESIDYDFVKNISEKIVKDL